MGCNHLLAVAGVNQTGSWRVMEAEYETANPHVQHLKYCCQQPTEQPSAISMPCAPLLLLCFLRSWRRVVPAAFFERNERAFRGGICATYGPMQVGHVQKSLACRTLKLWACCLSVLEQRPFRMWSSDHFACHTLEGASAPATLNSCVTQACCTREGTSAFVSKNSF